MKNLQKFESFDSFENELIKCGFEKIDETEIPNYTGYKKDSLKKYKSDHNYDFGYFGYDNFCIVHLDKSRGDDVLRYKDGSNDFIIKYNNQLYMGSFSEAEESLKDCIKNDDYITGEDHFDDFAKEMRNQNLDLFYTVSF